MSIQVRNKGTMVGKATLRLKVLDMVDEENHIWLMPGEVGTFSCSVRFDDDLEAGTYTGRMEVLIDDKVIVAGDVRFVLDGIKIKVDTRLDKWYYNKGDIAGLMLLVENKGAGTIALQAKVQEQIKAFEIKESGLATLVFDIPVDNGLEKLQYGIYTLSNRAVYLNACYLRQGEGLVIVPEKDVYLAGATMSLIIIAHETGTLTLWWMDDTKSYTINGTSTVLLKVPEEILSGSYPLRWEFNDKSGSLSIDVKGLEIQVVDAEFFEGLVTETSNTWDMRLRARVNQGCNGLVKIWLYSPIEGKYTLLIEKNVRFDCGINSINIIGSMTTSYSGSYRIIYGIYVGDMMCASGMEWVDITQKVVVTSRVYWGGNMISIPFMLDNATLQGVFGDDVSGEDIWMYQWDGQAYEYKPVIDEIEPGKGYWFGVLGTTTIDIAGDMVDESKEYSLTLNKGWNMIGCPFRFTPNWSKAMIKYQGGRKSFAEAEKQGWIKNRLFGFNPLEWEYYLSEGVKPMEGYWFAVMVDCKLIIPPIPVGIAGAPKQLEAPVLDGWQVNINASCGRYHDRLGIGAGKEARDGMDAVDEIKPPFISGVSISCHHPEELFGEFQQDVKGLSDRLVWDVRVKSNLLDEVVIDWNDLPSGYRFTLVDVETGKQMDMSTNRDYRYQTMLSKSGMAPGLDKINGVHSFIVIAAKEGAKAANIRVYPNPTSSKVIFDGVSPNVEIRIFTISGELVRIIQGSRIWQLDNETGKQVANGVYLWLVIDGEKKQTGKIGVIK